MQGTRVVEMEIDGLCCTECTLTVDRALKNLPGVTDYQLLFGAEKAVVTYLPSEVSDTQIARAVNATGYPVRRARVVGDPEQPTTADACTDGACECHTPVSDHTTSVPGQRLRVLRIGLGWDTLRFGFVAAVGVILLGEIVGEVFGWLDRFTQWLPAWLVLATAIVGGWPIFRRAFLGLRVRQANVDQMMTAGIIAALSIHQFVSAELLVFFMGIAHWLESFTVNRVRAALRQLVALTPVTARVLRDGDEREVPVEAVQAGEVIRVRPGERIPVDGRVTTGQATVNQAMITGESLPVEKGPGEAVYAGTFAERGTLDVTMERSGPQSMLGQIIHLVETAEAHKAPIQRFADRFTAWFLPIVVLIAAITYAVSHNLVAAIAVMVAACPCAVGLATPLSVVASVGSAARRGLLIKGGRTLEALARVDTLVTDKTGTLTEGHPRVTDVTGAQGSDEDAIVRLAATLEHYSEHPLATAVLEEAQRRGVIAGPGDGFTSMPGLGIGGMVEGISTFLGNRRWLAQHRVDIPVRLEAVASSLEAQGRTVLFLAHGGKCVGLLGIMDPLRPEVEAVLPALRNIGIKHLVILSGDHPRVVQAVAEQLEITDARAEALPMDKIAVVQALQAQGRVVAVVGDGVNDAPALAQADVGIAMGLTGTEIAADAADVVLLQDDWHQVIEAVLLGRRVAWTIRQNIGLGLLWNVLTVGLAAVGVIGPILAAASEAMPDVFVALNSSRLLHWRPRATTSR